MVCGIDIPKVGLDHVLDAFLVMDPMSYLIFQGHDFVHPSSIDGRGVEESSISISITQPIDLGFELPEVLLTSQDAREILLKLGF